MRGPAIPSLYDYQSPGGQFGTGGGNVNLFTVVRRFARLENNTEQAYGADTAGQANENTRLRSKPPTFKREANHVGGAMANIRFQNAEIETSYSGVQGAQTGCGAFGACYAGAWGLFPDMLFLFGNQEGVVDPYTFGPAAQPDFTSNLTMHLTFDEGTLTTAEDSTANNHDGTLGSGATWGPAKMGASAVVLDGTTNGVVTVTGELGTPAAVTLAAWVKASAFPTPTADLISIGDSVILRITSTAVRGDYYTGATWSNMSATRMLGTTDWHHLALVVQAGTQQLYLDGAPVASESNGAPIVYTGVGSNTILGGHGNGDTTNFRFQGSSMTCASRIFMSMPLRDTPSCQSHSMPSSFRCRGRGKTSIWDNTVSKRSGNVRLKNRAAGVVPSAARQSKLCKTVHTLYLRFGKPR